jgi:hypothetical protein
MRAALARAARLRVGVAAAATVTTSCAACERRACPGFEVPLDRRYKGTAAAREARGRGCLTDAEVVQCAEIINNFVDLPFFTEEQEQEIFEFSVCRLVERLAQVLPNEVINMIHSDQSLPRLPAAELEKRLHAWLVDTWQMPLLDELDRRHVVHCLLVLVMRSMRHCSRDVGDLTERETHELILDVFVKSTLDVFSDPAQRKELGARIEGYASSIPFLPAPLLSHAIDKFCALATEKVTPVLIHTYNEHLLATDIYRDYARLAAEGVAPNEQPFTDRLRRNLRAACDPATDEKRGFLGSVVALLPQDRREWYVGLFVDAFLEGLRTDKLEGILHNVTLDDALHQELIEKPFLLTTRAARRHTVVPARRGHVVGKSHYPAG